MAQLLHSNVVKAVEQALQDNVHEIKRDLTSQAKKMTEAKQRISDLEDELSETQAHVAKAESHRQELIDKLEDLENRSRQNNLRIIGLPESYKPQSLMDLIQSLIPKALGIKSPCIAERAHPIGPPQQERQSPRPVSVSELCGLWIMLIVQQLRAQRSLIKDGHKLIVFADYSVEVFRRRKTFSNVCSQLPNKKACFTLAYPAILRITTSEGQQHVFTDPEEAEAFISNMSDEPGPQGKECQVDENQVPALLLR